MKQRFLMTTLATLVVFAALAPQSYAADASKIVGVVTTITMDGAEATTATVVLKDTKSGELVEIVINDELTLDKLKDHRISEGDEIRCKYIDEDGRHVSTYFRKTAGC